MNNPLRAKIDWLEVTIKHQSPKKLCREVLNLDISEFHKLAKGRFGYNAQLKWERGNVFMLFNLSEDEFANDDMGVHLIFTGQGCDRFAGHMPLHDVFMLCIAESNCKFSRIDLAVDDLHEDLLKMNRVERYVKRGHFTSRWSNRLEVTKYQNSDNRQLGKTVYFGSKRSNLYCRFYDKALEQRQKLKNDPQKLKLVPKRWTRVEIVFKKERAQVLAKHLLNRFQLGITIREVFNNYLRFLKPGTDDNKSRWRSAAWWKAFIGEVGKLKLTVKPDDPTIPKMQNWLDRQISPTLSAVIEAKEGDLDWLFQMIRKAKARMKRKHLDAISQYQENVRRNA